MSQTSYSINMEKGMEGYIQDGHHVDGRSVIIEDSADLRCGIACAFGAKDDCVKKIAAGTDKLNGILIHKPNRVNERCDTSELKNGEVLTSVRQGRVWVKPVVDVAAGDPAYAVEASGELTNAVTAFKVGSFVSSGVAGELVQLDVEIC